MPPDFDDRFQKGEYNGADLRPRRQRHSDPVLHAAALPDAAPSPSRAAHLVNFAALEERGVRQDRRRDVRHAAERQTRKMMELFRKAMEIWLPELPDIQLVRSSTTASR